MSSHLYQRVAGPKLERTAANRSSWSCPDRSEALVWSLILAVPAAVVLLAFHAAAQINHPTDEELTAKFLSHESDFQTLVRMLDTDCARIPPRTDSCELANLLSSAALSTTRANDYKLLLARIGITSFRYFPRFGNLTLPVSRSGESLTEAKRSYLYLSHEEPQPLLRHLGYSWRGPGPYLLTGDHRIKSHWFIHHDETVALAFSPY